MATTKDSFLERVREAVRQGNRAGQLPALPERGSVGYQGAGNDRVARFEAECTAAGGRVYRVVDHEAAASRVIGLVQVTRARSVLLGRSAILDALDLPPRLTSQEISVVTTDDAYPAEQLYAADIAITGVDYLIAETGSLAIFARPDNPRAFSLLPPLYIAVADSSQILPDLFDLFGREKPDVVPSCITLITGPSKTGDIELRLVTGVHGPGEEHVVLIQLSGM
jgi:L-lactate utilization protein LutC